MERIIGDLLDLTQARLGGASPLTRVSTDLQRVCEEVMLESHEANPTVVLRFEHSGSLTGHWDADRLSQVVSNLVGNAIQHGDGTVVTLSPRLMTRWSARPLTAAHGRGLRSAAAHHR